jgi:hypothetical protein
MFFPRNFFGKCVSKYVIRDKKGRRGYKRNMGEGREIFMTLFIKHLL